MKTELFSSDEVILPRDTLPLVDVDVVTVDVETEMASIVAFEDYITAFEDQ